MCDDTLPELREYPVVMTLEQVADVLNVTIPTLRRLIPHPIPAFKVGREWRIRRSSVNSILTGELLAVTPDDEHGSAQVSP